MDTIRILDLYRIPLNSDKESLQILSYLLRYGPHNEDDIMFYLNLSSKETKNKVRVLFQASLIKKDENQNLALTELAKQYLLHSGFVELAAKSLVKEKNNPTWENSFLQACIETKSSINNSQANKFLNLLRAFEMLNQEGKKGVEKRKDVLNETKFILVIGLDPENRNLGSSRYFNAILNWHKKNSSSLWEEDGEDWLRNQSHLRFRCETAFNSALESTDFLLGQSSAPSEAAALASYIRVISSVLNDDPDPDLTAASWRTTDIAKSIWNAVTSFDKNSENNILKIIENNLSAARTTPSSLRVILARNFKKQSTENNDIGSIFLDSGEKSTNNHELLLALSQISNLKEKVEIGYFDKSSTTERTLLIKQIKSLENSFKNRWAK